VLLRAVGACRGIRARCRNDEDGNGDKEHKCTRPDQPSVSLPAARLSNDQFWLGELGLAFGRSRGNVWHNSANMLVTMQSVKRAAGSRLELHEKVAAEIRRDIANGDVRPGQRLPPARDMAAVLGVHTNTVLRALRTLRDEGVLEFRRGRGIMVSGEPERGLIWAQAQELLVQARRLGIRRDEVVSMIEGLP
jgi:DNA-binding transcriptional regulator YhcF (GntR family)